MTNRAKRRSVENGVAFLRERLISVERQFRDELMLTQQSITHDPTLGDAVEDAWIGLLRKYLPNRYCVAKAFAIDHQGSTTDQLDCLVYDAHFTPALFGKDRHLYVPAEAVYATFEIKQRVNAQHLQAAAKKAKSLRRLQRTSAPIPWANGMNPPKKPFSILAGLLAMECEWQDCFGRSFRKQFARWTNTEELDLVLTARSGFCDRFGPTPLTIASGEGTLIRALFRFLEALRKRATVAAIEWDRYESVLTSVPLTTGTGETTK
jgi:hypothetical protein